MVLSYCILMLSYTAHVRAANGTCQHVYVIMRTHPWHRQVFTVLWLHAVNVLAYYHTVN